MKKKKNRTYSVRLVGGLVAVCLIATLSFTSFVFANTGSSLMEVIGQVAGTIIGNNLTEQLKGESGDEMLGYVGDTPTHLTTERPGRLTPFANLFLSEDLEVDGTSYFDGAVTLSATTTPSVSTYYEIVDALDFTATSTALGASQTVIASYTNTGADLLIEWVGIDQTAANSIFESSYQVGTTTITGDYSMTATTSASIIASTTIATTFTTLTNGTVLDSHGAYGSGLLDNKIVFPLRNGETIFVTWTPYGATSSASFLSSGGFAGTGNLLIKARARGN